MNQSGQVVDGVRSCSRASDRWSSRCSTVRATVAGQAVGLLDRATPHAAATRRSRGRRARSGSTAFRSARSTARRCAPRSASSTSPRLCVDYARRRRRPRPRCASGRRHVTGTVRDLTASLAFGADVDLQSRVFDAEICGLDGQRRRSAVRTERDGTFHVHRRRRRSGQGDGHAAVLPDTGERRTAR